MPGVVGGLCWRLKDRPSYHAAHRVCYTTLTEWGLVHTTGAHLPALGMRWGWQTTWGGGARNQGVPYVGLYRGLQQASLLQPLRPGP